MSKSTYNYPLKFCEQIAIFWTPTKRQIFWPFLLVCLVHSFDEKDRLKNIINSWKLGIDTRLLLKAVLTVDLLEIKSVLVYHSISYFLLRPSEKHNCCRSLNSEPWPVECSLPVCKFQCVSTGDQLDLPKLWKSVQENLWTFGLC